MKDDMLFKKLIEDAGIKTHWLRIDFEGKIKRWAYWRDPRTPSSAWMLATHDGCIRTLAKTWAESVPMINLIGENYAGIFLQEVS